jgi:hypothetical protein
VALTESSQAPPGCAASMLPNADYERRQTRQAAALSAQIIHSGAASGPACLWQAMG